MFASTVGCAEEVFVSSGFSHWKNAAGVTGKLRQHAASRTHLLSAERFTFFMTTPPVDAQLSEQRAAQLSRLEQERSENRQVVETLFDCIRFLGTLGLAFRGHDAQSGNFVATVQFLGKYYPPLQTWLDKHPGNVSYMSAEIQNEMITIVGTQIIQTIRDRVKYAKWFSICADETADNSKTEQVSIIVRYIYDGTVQESLIAVNPAISLTGSELAKLIIRNIKELGVEPCNLVAQCYDGASNMRGQFSGVQKFVKDAAGERAIYIWCWAHCLNLVLESYVKKASTLALRTFGVLQQLYVYIERSPKRHRHYMDQLEAAAAGSSELDSGPKLLQSLCATRWSARFTNLRIVDRRLPEIIKTLNELSHDDVDAAQLCKSLMQFEIVFEIKLLRLVFGYANEVSEYLQKTDIDVFTAFDRVSALKATLQDCRSDNKFDLIWQEATDTCKSLCIALPHESGKRPRKVSKSLHDFFLLDSSVAAGVGTVGIDIREQYKIDNYLATLDIVISDIDDRFGMQATETVRLMSSMCIWRDYQSDDTDNIRRLASTYQLDSDRCVDQYGLLRNDQSVKHIKSLGSLVQHMFTHRMHETYSVVFELACILLTIPVSSAGCERVFSKLKLVKNELRSTMGDDRLNSLMLMAVEKEIIRETNLQVFVDTFALKPRKLKL